MMNRLNMSLLISALALALVGSAIAQLSEAQTPDPMPATQARTSEVVRVGSGYTLRAGERAEAVVVISGDAVIEGEVDSDVVVILGALRLADTAVVGGDVVVIGGLADVGAGAGMGGDLVVVGGTLDAPPGFSPGGEQVILGLKWDRLGPDLRWLGEGLLWGRLIVPGLNWVWAVVLIFALLYLAISLVFERQVRACGEALSEKPLTTCLAGVLTLLLFGPVTVVLTVSIIGLPVVPFLWFALLLASLLGKVGVARWIGGRVVVEESPGDRLQATRSLTIGITVITLVYMVPVLGLATWVVLSVLGLGMATTTFFKSLRREHPEPLSPPSESGAPTPRTDLAAGDEPAMASADVPAVDPDHSSPHLSADLAILAALSPASFISRMGAVVLDVILVMIACALLEISVRTALLIFLVYHVALWSWKSTTVGGIICQVRVVRADRTPLLFTDALVRGLASIFSVAVAGLGWFWALWDARQQAWHDKIAGTYVVRVPPDLPLQ